MLSLEPRMETGWSRALTGAPEKVYPMLSARGAESSIGLHWAPGRSSGAGHLGGRWQWPGLKVRDWSAPVAEKREEQFKSGRERIEVGGRGMQKVVTQSKLCPVIQRSRKSREHLHFLEVPSHPI